MKLAAISPLLAIAIAIGWAVIQGLAKRRQDADSWDDLGEPKEIPPLQAPRPPVIPRQMTRPVAPQQLPARPIPSTLPKKPRPIIAQREGPDIQLAHLDQSQLAYASASHLQQTVERKMADVDRQTATHRPAT